MASIVSTPVIANTEEIRFTPYITVSGILHGGLIVLLAMSAYFHWNGNRWAGPGGGSDSAEQPGTLASESVRMSAHQNPNG